MIARLVCRLLHAEVHRVPRQIFGGWCSVCMECGRRYKLGGGR